MLITLIIALAVAHLTAAALIPRATDTPVRFVPEFRDETVCRDPSWGVGVGRATGWSGGSG